MAFAALVFAATTGMMASTGQVADAAAGSTASGQFPPCLPSIGGSDYVLRSSHPPVVGHNLDTVACEYTDNIDQPSVGIATIDLNYVPTSTPASALPFRGADGCGQPGVYNNPEVVSPDHWSSAVILGPTNRPELFDAARRLIGEADHGYSLACGPPAQAAPTPSLAPTPTSAPAPADRPYDSEDLLWATLLIMALLIGATSFPPELFRAITGRGYHPGATPPQPLTDAGAPPPSPAATVPTPDVPLSTLNNPQQVDDLEQNFGLLVERRRAEGYFVRNPTVVQKAWNSTLGRYWEWMQGEIGGTCGDYADMGVEWVKPSVNEIFGPGAIVDSVWMETNAWGLAVGMKHVYDVVLPINHAATRVILPDGRRYILDFWDAIGNYQPNHQVLIPEDTWRQTWEERLGGGGHIVRSNLEIQLREQIDIWGFEDGTKHFRKAVADHMTDRVNSLQVEALIRSWQGSPW